jgi:large conductance mechanosensitive channel
MMAGTTTEPEREEDPPVLSGFRAFLVKSNALALAIGVIIGAALGSVVTSLVNDIIMPPIGYLLGGVDFSQIVIHLNNGGPPDIRIGAFINSVITFVAIAFVVWRISVTFIREAPPDEIKTCPYCKEANAVDATRCKACTSEI